MQDLRSLKAEKNRLLKVKAKNDEIRAIKSEIRQMKYGNLIGGFKSVGKAIGSGANKVANFYDRPPAKKSKKSSGYGFSSDVLHYGFEFHFFCTS